MNAEVPAQFTLATLDTLRTQPIAAAAANEILWHSHQVDDPGHFLSTVLSRLATTLGADYLAVASAAGGRWTMIAEAGRNQPLPEPLLAEAMDRETPQSRNDWIAVPLSTRNPTPEALVARAKPPEPAPPSPSPKPASNLHALLILLAPLLYDSLTDIRRRAAQQRRSQRLETVFQLVKQWSNTHEVEPLLAQVAEASTRLLHVDRASIFLWDRTNHTLVARPALGVKNGELRIPDNRGVVGRVIQSGRPCRVDAHDDAHAIDRHVDTQLGYHTRTLLCVPLRGSTGELLGAFELINKLSGNFNDEDEATLVELAAMAAMALENVQNRQELLATTRQIAQQAAERIQIIGQSPTIAALRSITRRVADTDLSVLILGENGTGKEVIAQAVHYWSRRRDKPFIAVNCAAIPEALAESELFGHEKGAFTDARETRPGKFELAAGGTLFLDEIGDLSLAGQAKLLRVLEEKVFVRVGGSTPIHTDARVIAATNQQLAEMVRQKRFREDLYFRLNVVSLDLPPLRNRPEDIIPLAEHFLKDFCAKARRRMLEISPAAITQLQNHAWPGNVRELRNLMERMAYLSTADRIEPEDLAFILAPHGQPAPADGPSHTLTHATELFQIDYIKRSIKLAGGNMSDAATRLGLHRSNLYRKMRQLGMSAPP